MIRATLSEARANLSNLIKRAQRGDVVIITSGRDRSPVAKLEPVQPKGEKRLGALETPGFVLSPAFFQPLDEEEQA